MRRHFTLEEIAFDEFNKYRKQLCIPLLPYRPRKRFFKMADSLSFNSLSEVLANMQDNLQSARCIWIPGGNLPLGEAKRRTLNDTEKYFSMLCEKESEYEKILIDLSKSYRPTSHYSDIFEFQKESSLWTLRYFNIHHPNFGLYTFEYRNSLHFSFIDEHAIYGIFPK